VVASNIRLAGAPGNIKLTRRQSGLPKDSVINVSQIITIDKSYLTERVGKLPQRILTSLEEGLRLVSSL
jgi:mRNA interferase MazF